jgi:hypothetical protein
MTRMPVRPKLLTWERERAGLDARVPEAERFVGLAAA